MATPVDPAAISKPSASAIRHAEASKPLSKTATPYDRRSVILSYAPLSDHLFQANASNPPLAKELG